MTIKLTSYYLIVQLDLICNLNNTIEYYFDFENVQGVGFDLHTESGFQGFYSYDELPLTIEVPLPDGGGDVLSVCA